MATVIGTDATKMLQVTCRKCASRLEYTEGEVRTLWSGKDYSGGSDGAKGFSWPKCGLDVITEQW